jgi:hypothetical protein
MPASFSAPTAADGRWFVERMAATGYTAARAFLDAVTALEGEANALRAENARLRAELETVRIALSDREADLFFEYRRANAAEAELTVARASHRAALDMACYLDMPLAGTQLDGERPAYVVDAQDLPY